MSATSRHSERDITSSLAEYLAHEQHAAAADDVDEEVDIPSILEEINRLSAASPLSGGGASYRKDIGLLSIDEIMREAEKIYMESSKSFEQLSQHSKTSQNVSELSREPSSEQSTSTPTPKSVSPLPLDEQKAVAVAAEESDSETESLKAAEAPTSQPSATSVNYTMEFESVIAADEEEVEDVDKKKSRAPKEESSVIVKLLDENGRLKDEVQSILREVDKLKSSAHQRNVQPELGRALEALKDAREANTALQLQLQEANAANASLRATHDEVLATNTILERRLIDLDSMLGKYKADLRAIQAIRDKLKENEFNAAKQLEHERSTARTHKAQAERDAKCILDLNRQIKEMERIIARKHPDSVSALIVASKHHDDQHAGTRKVLEERVKSLEAEALLRDAQNSAVFLDVQEKFNQMKLKYESHIDDLELHVNDLKSQLKRRADTYDVYTQTQPYFDEKIPAKDTTNGTTQTDATQPAAAKARSKAADAAKEDTHLVATIRGYQSELGAKEKAIVRLQKDVDELRKTNRRLQKEREGSLRTAIGDQRRHLEHKGTSTLTDDEEVRSLRSERDKMKAQLCRIEDDYQALKQKRLQDLNTLQEAHEREISTYLANVTPLREKLDVQQVSLTALQQQVMAAKEELAVVTVERDHLNNKLNTGMMSSLLADACNNGNDAGDAAVQMRKQMNAMELKYEERETRLRAIVHGLAQKSITNRACTQCAERQQQLVGYKAELDQIIATLRCLQ